MRGTSWPWAYQSPVCFGGLEQTLHVVSTVPDRLEARTLSQAFPQEPSGQPQAEVANERATLQMSNYGQAGAVKLALRWMATHRFLRTAAVGVLALVGCSSDAGESSGNGELIGVSTLETYKDLPECNPSRRGVVYYVRAKRELAYCDGKHFVPLSLASNTGADGKTWIVEPRAAGGCENGGVAFAIGPDENENGVLDPDEVESQTAVCNGAEGPQGPEGADGLPGEPGATGEPGQASLIDARHAYEDECPEGGYVLLIGSDANADAVLQPAEVQHERPVCNGTPGQEGEAGADGKSSLITTSPASSNNCPAGGIAINTGVDDDGDGALDESEVDDTEVLCSPEEPPSSECAPLSADCNADPADGCEINLSSNGAHCGACGNACGLANVATSCINGQCLVGACEPGFGDCDLEPSNGCEQTFLPSQTCEEATGLPGGRGDTECLILLNDCYRPDDEHVYSVQGIASGWFRSQMHGSTHGSCNNRLEHDLTLTSPPGNDFDLYVYSACGQLIGSSTSGSGVDRVTIQSPRFTGSSNMEYWMEVRYVSGASCGQWSLSTYGGRC